MEQTVVLITGTTGFVGGHVAQKLLEERRYRLVAIVRRGHHPNKLEQLRSKGVILVDGQFYDEELLSRVFRDYPVQQVIHLAAMRGAGQKGSYHRVNVLGTEALLRASLRHNVSRFVFCSSVGVFGTLPSEVPASLNTGLCGDNEYHQSKILAEEQVRRYMALGLDAYIVRPTITYGIGDNGFPSTLARLVRKRRLLIPRRDIMIHLLDVHAFAEVVARLLSASRSAPKEYLVADESPVSLRELADVIHLHFHGAPYPFFLRVPAWVHRVLILIFRGLGSEKWLTRVQLISGNWCYATSETYQILNFKPSDTRKRFLEFVQTVQ